MATFKILTNSGEQKLMSIGRTGAMKNMMKALEDVIKALDENVESEKRDTHKIWEGCAHAFENFGFRVVFDRNLIILLLALFAAWAHDENMRVLAAKVIRNEVTDSKGQKITLGQALLDGYGKTIYKILNCQNFRTILKKMGISDKCITKFLNRLKKITPWYLSASVGVARTVKEALEKMTGIEYREGPSLTEAERQALNEAEHKLNEVREKITSEKEELTELNKQMKAAKEAAKQEAEKPDGKKEYKEQSQKAIPALEMAEKMIEDTLTYLGKLSQSVEEKLNSVRNAAREEPALSSESKTSQGTKQVAELAEQALELAKNVDKQLNNMKKDLNKRVTEIFSKQNDKSSPAGKNVLLGGIVDTVKNALDSVYEWIRWGNQKEQKK